MDFSLKPYRLILLSLLSLFFLGCEQSSQTASDVSHSRNAKTEYGYAAIATPDNFGSDVSQEILNKGGNAVDAAIATGFALAVTYIDAGNIGGGGFMTIKMNDEVAFLDYREKAPKAAHRDMYLDENGDVIEYSSLIGGQAVGVPGTVAGFWKAHQRFGKLPWEELVNPAIKLAEEGFLPAKILVDDIQSMKDWFKDKTNFSKYFLSINASENFKQPELANTLRRIAKFGADDFYSGETAKLIVEQMKESDGLITMEDLNSYEAIWREPLRSNWRNYEVISAPPPSSGGFAIIQLLKMKDYLDHFFSGLEHNSAQYIHLVAEMEKRVFADRAEYLGDPDFFDVDIEKLISEEYIARRALEVNPNAISSLESVDPGLESPDTTHYSIVDQWGNAVSNTYTINWNYGSGVVVEGAGFLLNNEMDDFSAKPGVPNIFGVVGNVANEIQPEKRMLSSMSPTILLKDGNVEMVLGTPGGSTIFTSVFQTIVNIMDFDMSPYEAIESTRFHHQLLPPDEITYNGFTIGNPLPKETISQLGEKGYKAIPHDYDFGDVQVIMREDESWIAASDPRDRGDSRIISVPTSQENQ
tara:strand:+ start:1041 stop:2792 length:1752 start_codon:yes stop_codon:yes gene_type:complete